MRPALALIAVVLAGVLTGPLPAAQPAAAEPRPVTVAAKATQIRGWAATTATVAAGKPIRVRVVVSGKHRVVRLQRLVDGRWRSVDLRHEKQGAALLRWTPPSTASRVVLRVAVKATPRWDAARTGRRIVTVLPSARAVPVPAGTPAPTATPIPAATPVPIPAPVPVASPSPVPSAAPAPSDPELDRVLELVNRERASGATCGTTAFPAAGPLTRFAPLDGVAQAYAQRMASENFFAHTSPDGGTPSTRAAAAGLPAPAENIAAGYRTAERVVTGWLASEGHCRNIMNASYTRVGLGRADSTTATYPDYWVQNFLR